MTSERAVEMRRPAHLPAEDALFRRLIMLLAYAWAVSP
jgi:hypothetical protein